MRCGIERHDSFFGDRRSVVLLQITLFVDCPYHISRGHLVWLISLAGLILEICGVHRARVVRSTLLYVDPLA